MKDRKIYKFKTKNPQVIYAFTAAIARLSPHEECSRMKARGAIVDSTDGF